MTKPIKYAESEFHGFVKFGFARYYLAVYVEVNFWSDMYEVWIFYATVLLSCMDIYI